MHIALVNIAASGHVNPSLPLVGDLVKQGHRVSYFCTTDYEPVIRHAGAGFQPFQTLLASRMAAPIKPKLPDELPTLLMEEAEFVAPQILAALATDRVDALIFDSFCIAGRIVARTLAVPTVQLRATYAANSQFSLIRRSVTHAPDHLILERERALADRFSRQHGIDGFNLHAIFEHAEKLNIVFVSPAFHPAAEHFGSDHVLVGPQIAERIDASVWQPPPNGLPLIYMSFGTVFGNNPRLYPTLIEALGQGRWRAIASVNSVPLGNVPANVTLMTHAPQLDILQHTSLFITHAGMNSVQEALWFGVPTIALPQMHEQAFSARRLVELGLGQTLDDYFNRSADEVCATIEQVLADQAIRKRVTEFRELTRQSGGHARATEEILKFFAAGGRR